VFPKPENKRKSKRPHQDVEAGGLQQGDLVGDGERGEAGQLLGELHRLDDALGGQLAELVPQIDVQRHAVLRTVVLEGGAETSESENGWLSLVQLNGRQ